MSATLTAVPFYVAERQVGLRGFASRLAAVLADAAGLAEEERKRRIAYVIRTARERRGMTPPQLAEKVKVGRGVINDWEAMRSTPSLVYLGPLCAALALEPRAFAAGTADRHCRPCERRPGL